MAAEESEFPTGLRGYDRGAVDDAIRDFRREILALSTQNATLAAELRQTQNELIEAQNQLGENIAPSYAGVGARAAQILSNAEELAKRIVNDAEIERAAILAGIENEVEAKRTEGSDFYEALVAEANRRADRIINAAKTDYDETLAKATNEAERIVDEALRDAGAKRGAIATEVARARASAKRDVETLKTKTERDLAERKLIVERALKAGLDESLANNLVSQQARIDLELELTARRAEAEAEYLRKHQEAVMQTQKYLDEANRQMTDAMARVSTARLEADTLEAAARSVNRSTTDAARERAEQIIAAAEAEARATLASAAQRNAAMIRELDARTRNLVLERDNIVVYLDNLRQVIDEVKQGIRRAD